MQRLEVSGVVRLIYGSLGFKGLNQDSISNYAMTVSLRIFSSPLFIGEHLTLRGPEVCRKKKIEYTNVATRRTDRKYTHIGCDNNMVIP